MRNIAVIAGGYTSERHISLNSAKQILASINKEKYAAYMVDVRKDGFFCQLENEEIRVDINDFSFITNNQKVKIDFAYITLHGTPGEDGKVQAMLDLIGIPYSASDHISSVTTFDKVLCKKALSGASVYMAKSVVIKGETPFSVDQITNYVGLPCFVKPNTAGSSYGVTKVYKADEFIEAVNLARTEDTTVIVEEFIDGVEVSCGILKTKNNEYVFPVTEIATKNDYFDTDAKYDPTLTDEITPERISDEETKQVQNFCSHIYDKLDCKGIVRIDFIIQNGKPYFLEVNSMPGMSAESIVPKQIRTMGKELGDFITEIVEDCF
ncbi:MAG: D-alanine--D-alanine ligase [Marinilabiliales bacterium]|nr:MAG: D-alanine--D-alanine ligase [Marinilabiliales bacterium]